MRGEASGRSLVTVSTASSLSQREGSSSATKKTITDVKTLALIETIKQRTAVDSLGIHLSPLQRQVHCCSEHSSRISSDSSRTLSYLIEQAELNVLTVIQNNDLALRCSGGVDFVCRVTLRAHIDGVKLLYGLPSVTKERALDESMDGHLYNLRRLAGNLAAAYGEYIKPSLGIQAPS
jgi:hypothetical protein